MIPKAIATALLILLLASGTALAHKIRIFAYEENGFIVGETAFSGGKSPKNVEIQLEDAASGTLLLSTKTDQSGNFSFPVPEVAKEQQLDLEVIVNVGDGHKNSWLLEAADYLPGVSSAASAQTAPQSAMQMSETPSQVIAEKTASLSSGDCVSISNTQLRLVINEVVSQQLSPIKHMLAESREQKTSLKDILGGIGYIMGLAGIAAYMKAKKGDVK